jgi:hypothetical protein
LPALANPLELLGPAAAKARRYPLAAAQLSDDLLAAKLLEHDADLLLCLRA